jgi:hypothetical protein
MRVTTIPAWASTERKKLVGRKGQRGFISGASADCRMLFINGSRILI